MKITVLDGYTLNPGDLSWDALAALGELTVYDRTPPAQVVERAREADIVFTNKTRLGEEEIASIPSLRYIGVLATGYDVVDISAAVKRRITVTNIPAYGTKSVAQMVFALLLELCRGVRPHSDAVKAGEWIKSGDFCFWKSPQVELDGKTMGIIGFGRIGRATAEIALAFGMNILVHDVAPEGAGRGAGVRWADLEELLKSSDVVSLHCPLTPATRGLIGMNTLRLMKRSAFLINTSRGPLIVEDDLAQALNEGSIAGAGLDVLSVEPPAGNNPLLAAKNCVITPHIAWATREARTRLMDIAVDNLRMFLAGRPVNTV